MVMIGDLHFNVGGTPGNPDGGKNRFEAEISGSAQVVASMESDTQNNNTTRRFAVAAEVAKIDTRKPPEEIIIDDPPTTDPND